MRIMDRYLLKHFIVPFLFCLFMFVLTYVVIDLFDNLNEMIEDNINLTILIPYYINFAPLIFVQITPIAVLISVMYSLGTFNKNNEIIAMQASGISLMRILSPLIVAGFIISVAVFLVNDRIVPESTMRSSAIKEEKIELSKTKKKQQKGQKILENLAFYGDGNKIIYIGRYSVYENLINDIIIHDQDKNQNIISKTTATEAQWIDGKWFGKVIVFFPLDNNGKILGEPEYLEEGYLSIKETPIDLRKRKHQSQFMSFEFMSYKELSEYIERLSFESGPTIRNLKVSLNQKIAFPFASFIVVLIASPFALVHTRRGGVMVGIAISMALVFGYYSLMTICLALGKNGFIQPFIAAWLTNGIFALIGFLTIIRHK